MMNGCNFFKKITLSKNESEINNDIINNIKK